MAAKEQTDHDLLIEAHVKLDALTTQFTNHLHHHFLYTMALFTAFLSLVGTSIVYIVTH